MTSTLKFLNPIPILRGQLDTGQLIDYPLRELRSTGWYVRRLNPDDSMSCWFPESCSISGTAHIPDTCTIGASVKIGENVKLGANVTLEPGVALTQTGQRIPEGVCVTLSWSEDQEKAAA